MLEVLKEVLPTKSYSSSGQLAGNEFLEPEESTKE